MGPPSSSPALCPGAPRRRLAVRLHSCYSWALGQGWAFSIFVQTEFPYFVSVFLEHSPLIQRRQEADLLFIFAFSSQAEAGWHQGHRSPGRLAHSELRMVEGRAGEDKILVNRRISLRARRAAIIRATSVPLHLPSHPGIQHSLLASSFPLPF